MKKRLAQLLEMAELKPEEVTIYLHLLKLKSATIPQLTTETGLNTMMVYRTLKRLIDRELVKSHPVNNKQNTYTACTLTSLVEKVSKEQIRLAKLETAFRGLDHILPYLDLSTENNDQEMIDIREGKEAMLEEYLKIPDICQTEFLHIGSVTRTWDLLGLDFDCAEERNFIKRRMNKGVHARVLNEHVSEMERIARSDTKEKRTTRLKENLPVMHNYLLIADTEFKLFINNPEHPRVITIKQPDLLKTQKDQFYHLWSSDTASRF